MDFYLIFTDSSSRHEDRVNCYRSETPVPLGSTFEGEEVIGCMLRHHWERFTWGPMRDAYGRLIDPEPRKNL